MSQPYPNPVIHYPSIHIAHRGRGSRRRRIELARGATRQDCDQGLAGLPGPGGDGSRQRRSGRQAGTAGGCTARAKRGATGEQRGQQPAGQVRRGGERQAARASRPAGQAPVACAAAHPRGAAVGCGEPVLQVSRKRGEVRN